MIITIITVSILVAIIIKIYLQNLLLVYKTNYYETKLHNHKSKFSEEQYKHIENMKSKKSIFDIK